jgi:hypothetical protein
MEVPAAATTLAAVTVRDDRHSASVSQGATQLIGIVPFVGKQVMHASGPLENAEAA